MESVLDDTDRAKLDDGDDGAFYDSPRLVTHADEPFLARLTDLYASVLDPGDRVFDAMGSWVSHLPADDYERVVVHGLNAAELDRNQRADERFVRNFNREQSLPLADDAFDAVLCALSVQYLQYPEAVFREFARVLAPGGVLVVSFTNRMFPTKAVRAWRAASMDERADLVAAYCRAADLPVVETVRERPGEDPFYAVVAERADGR
jgi:SAM-dependent methyltransferase